MAAEVRTPRTEHSFRPRAQGCNLSTIFPIGREILGVMRATSALVVAALALALPGIAHA